MRLALALGRRLPQFERAGRLVDGGSGAKDFTGWPFVACQRGEGRPRGRGEVGGKECCPKCSEAPARRSG